MGDPLVRRTVQHTTPLPHGRNLVRYPAHYQSSYPASLNTSQNGPKSGDSWLSTCPTPSKSHVSIPNARFRDTVGQFVVNSSVGLATSSINGSSVTIFAESNSNCGGNSVFFIIPSHWLTLGLITTTIRSDPKHPEFGQRFHYQMPKLSHNSNKVISKHILI